MTFIRVLLSVLDTKKDRDAHMGQFTVFNGPYFVIPGRISPAEGILRPLSTPFLPRLLRPEIQAHCTTPGPGRIGGNNPTIFAKKTILKSVNQ